MFAADGTTRVDKDGKPLELGEDGKPLCETAGAGEQNLDEIIGKGLKEIESGAKQAAEAASGGAAVVTESSGSSAAALTEELD